MALIERTKQYFKAFSDKDLNVLRELFAENITLRDWETNKKGKKDLLEHNKIFFNSVRSIQVNPLAVYQIKNTVIAELNILIDDAFVPLKVVDVLVYDESNRICAIRAYRG